MDITSKTIRDRIVELRRVAARELVPNPKNWRRHPARQAAALRGVLEEIGYADALLARAVARWPSDADRRPPARGNHARPAGAGAGARRRRSRSQQAARDTRSAGSDGRDRQARVQGPGWLRPDRQRRVARVARRNGRHREGDPTGRDSRASGNPCGAFGPDLATRQAPAAVRRFYAPARRLAPDGRGTGRAVPDRPALCSRLHRRFASGDQGEPRQGEPQQGLVGPVPRSGTISGHREQLRDRPRVLSSIHHGRDRTRDRAERSLVLLARDRHARRCSRRSGTRSAPSCTSRSSG